MTALVLVLAAAAMFAFGRWGQRNATGLIATSALSAESRLRKERAVRRGSVAWQIIAVLPFLAAVVLLIDR